MENNKIRYGRIIKLNNRAKLLKQDINNIQYIKNFMDVYSDLSNEELEVVKDGLCDSVIDRIKRLGIDLKDIDELAYKDSLNKFEDLCVNLLHNITDYNVGRFVIRFNNASLKHRQRYYNESPVVKTVINKMIARRITGPSESILKDYKDIQKGKYDILLDDAKEKINELKNSRI